MIRRVMILAELQPSAKKKKNLQVTKKGNNPCLEFQICKQRDLLYR